MDTTAKPQNETTNQITTASIKASSPTPVKADAVPDTETAGLSLPKADLKRDIDLTAPSATPTQVATGVGVPATPKQTAPVIKIPVPAGDKNLEVAAIAEQAKTRQLGAVGNAAQPPAPTLTPKVTPPAMPTPVNTLPSPSPTDRAVAGDPGPLPKLDPTLTREQKITELLKQQYLRVVELEPGANFSHRGFCAKCGWQTYQHSAQAAAELVTTHIMSHWKDVVRFL